MACSTALCLSAPIASPASCSSSSRFLAVGHASRVQVDYSREAIGTYVVSAKPCAEASQNKRSSGGNVVMVDPLEAKRLAARQMQEFRAREKLKKRRQAEAINGALAMIGLTTGLIVEGQTGKGILGQLAGYLAAISSLFGQ